MMAVREYWRWRLESTGTQKAGSSKGGEAGDERRSGSIQQRSFILACMHRDACTLERGNRTEPIKERTGWGATLQLPRRFLAPSLRFPTNSTYKLHPSTNFQKVMHPTLSLSQRQ
ncbi:hypothetical protein GOP47_0005775 [Adiantum capillus-veneris]|uniref:Uncharacterized protein n=1 Tax=Adiantum capillus-veneris TaxID=13818 RepID=A0A9D4V5P3_ADICA|nr:hypothetical protein GOP47_0005775 [Adiantum capillus-veneris]